MRILCLIKRIGVAVACLLLLLSCATVRKARIDTTAKGQIVWPGKPEKPRIEYLWTLQYLGGPEGKKRGIGDLIAGKTYEDVTDPVTSNILLRPQGIYVDSGRYYIADPGAYRVTVIDRKTGDVTQITEADGRELGFPKSVVADNEGNIYVADSDRAEVFIFGPDYKYRGTLGGGFKRPVGLAIDRKSGRIYVVDINAHNIKVYAPDGKLLRIIGQRGSGPGEFNFPNYAFVDRQGNLYVTDFLNFRIQVFGPDGRFLNSFGRLGDSYDAFDKPKGLAVDSQGHIYVVDNAQDTVKIFDRQGRLLMFFGETGHGYGEFYMPTGIFIDENDTIYVADTINMRVQAFKFLGGD